MCGIAGFLGGEKSYNLNDSSPIINSMLNKIHHRGPDDHGSWSDSHKGINLPTYILILYIAHENSPILG